MESHQASIGLALGFQLLVLLVVVFEGFLILLQVVVVEFRFILLVQRSILLIRVGVFFLIVLMMMMLENPLDERFFVLDRMLRVCFAFVSPARSHALSKAANLQAC